MSTTPALTAGQLRKLADALDTADDTPISVYVSISDADYCGKQTARVATVDAIAKLLGLTAEPTKNSSLWQHEASDDRDGVRLRVYTHIDAPAQRCACGAECTHTVAGGAR